MNKARGQGQRGARKKSDRRPSRTMKEMAAWQCTVCDSPCEDKEHTERSIECFVCKKWAHKACTGIKDDMFDNLTEAPSTQWVCMPCLESKGELQSRNGRKLDMLLSMIPLMESLTTRMEKLEEGLMGKKLEETIEEVVDKKVTEMMEEHREIDKRKSNFIIVNLKESTKADSEERKQEDLQEVHGLLGGIVELCDDDIENPVRLGAAGGNRPRMLRISMKSEQKRKMVLKKKSPELNKNVPIEKRIYVNQDFTKKQREANNALRDELKRRTKDVEENLSIRGGKIVKWKPKQLIQERRRQPSHDDSESEEDAAFDDQAAAAPGHQAGKH